MLWPAGDVPNYRQFSSGAIFKRTSSILTFTAFYHPTNRPMSEIRLEQLKINLLPCSMGVCAVAQLVEALRYKSEGRGFDSRWCHWNFSLTYSFWPQYGPGVDSSSNRNEFQQPYVCNTHITIFTCCCDNFLYPYSMLLPSNKMSPHGNFTCALVTTTAHIQH